jgi:leucyl aminopeptidase
MALPKIELATSGSESSDAIVLGWFSEDEPGGAKHATPHFLGQKSKDLEALSQQLKASKHFHGRKGETSFLRYHATGKWPNTLLLGLGSPKKWSPEMARQAGAAIYLAQRREKLGVVTVQEDALFAKVPADQAAYYHQAFCEGYLLASYDYREFKKDDPNAFLPRKLEVTEGKSAAFKAAVKRATVLAEAVCFARSLGDKPSNHLTPALLAREAQSMAKAHGLKCTVLARPQIEKEKMGLLLGVSKGSAEDPRFIILEHRGGKKTDKPIALVGKGVTFDSGGISLKPAAQMEDMKYDMMGAGAVIGAMQAIADLNLPVNVMGFVAATENLPGGRAQKPGDVVRSSKGKSVEIINTDAEGRLILADALEYAQQFEPQAILDLATLTGAVVVALGTVVTGIMGNHPGLIGHIKEAAGVTGERVWELPLYEEYEEDLKSNFADIKNSGVRDAGSSKGGTFLKFFVDSKIPWVHFDIAGAAYHRKDANYSPAKFASGVMVRLLAHLLENWKPLK